MKEQTYKMSEAEARYLEEYDITKLDRPALAADDVVLTVMGNRAEQTDFRDPDNFRKELKKELKVLMIQRSDFPFRGMWSLPGGFCENNEEVPAAAARKLFEETQIKDAHLSLLGVFSDKDRDPRGWVVSNAFVTLVDGEQARPVRGSDADEAEWFRVKLEKTEVFRQSKEGESKTVNQYALELQNNGGDITLNALIGERIEFVNLQKEVTYKVIQSEGIAFDHAKMILLGILCMRGKLGHDDRVIFDCMPEQFTFAQLQNAVECILGRPLLVPNFRRKMSDYLVETDLVIEGVGHRPARLLKRDMSKFY